MPSTMNNSHRHPWLRNACSPSLLGVIVGLSLFAPPLLTAQPERSIAASQLYEKKAQVDLETAETPNGTDGSAEGLYRLPLPPEVLEKSGSDLADLRLEDGAGQEIAFFLDSSFDSDRSWSVVKSVEAELLGVDRRTRQSETRRDVLVETYPLAPPPGDGIQWQLVLDTDLAEFERRASVTFVGLPTQTTGGPGLEVVSTSLFRISNPARERLTITLPRRGPDSQRPQQVVVRLEAELAGRSTANASLEGRFRYRSLQLLDTPTTTEVELAVATRDEYFQDRKTRYPRTSISLERPPGLLPNALLIDPGTPTFQGLIEVRDQGGALLGRGPIYRLAAAGLEKIKVELDRPPSGKYLHISSPSGDSQFGRSWLLGGDDDQGNPSFRAEVRTPALVFAIDPEHSLPVALLFSSQRSLAARYSKTGSRERLEQYFDREAIEFETALRDSNRHRIAALGPIVDNPSFSDRPAFEFAQRSSAALESSLFAFRRRFEAQPSEDGVIKLRLDAATLSRSQDDLDDLRIVDTEGNQWAYVIDREVSDLAIEFKAEEPITEDRETNYLLTADGDNEARLAALQVDFEEKFFQRKFSLQTGDGKEIAVGTLERRLGDTRPISIAIRSKTRLNELRLKITDGDDRPLTLTHAVADLPTAHLLAPALAGNYFLLTGNDSTGPPSYELGTFREPLLSVEANPVNWQNDFEANSDHRSPARFNAKHLMLVAIVLAVLVLAFLVRRTLAESNEEQ